MAYTVYTKTGTDAAIAAQAVPLSQLGASSGVATLDGAGTVVQIPKLHAARHAPGAADDLSAYFSTPSTQVVVPAQALIGSDGSSLPAVSGVDGSLFAQLPKRLSIYDTIARADSATAIGAADTGQTATVTGTWGVASNLIYNPSAGNGNRATYTGTQADCDFATGLTILPANGSVQFLLRYTDSSNYVYAAILPTGAVQIADVVAGTFTTRATSANGAYTASAAFRFRVRGAKASVFINDLPVLSYTGLSNTTGTGFGFRNGGTDGAWRIMPWAVSDNQRFSADVYVPDGWNTYDIAVGWDNLTSTAATGNVRYQYEERAYDPLTAVLATVPIATVTATGVSAYLGSETILATGRTPPASRMLAVAVKRLCANSLDTLNDVAGLKYLVLRKAS